MSIVKVAINIPSGKLICANDLREEFPLSGREDFNVNETVGIKQTIEAYAKVGMFHGFCGNSCPGLYLDGNKLTIASLAYDDEKDEPIDDGSLGKEVGSICTDLWWYSVADYDEFIARGGKVDKRWDTVVDVEPGRYVLTHNLERKDDWKELEIFATIERSDEEIVPWKLPEEGAAEEITKRLPQKYLTTKIIDVDPPKNADLKYWKERGYDKHTMRTWLAVETAWKRLTPRDEYPSKYEKVGYKLWGHLFDGEEEIFIRDVIVNEEQIQDYDYMVKRAVDSFEEEKIEKAFEEKESKWFYSLPMKEDKTIDHDKLTKEQKDRLEAYNDRIMERLKKLSPELDF